MKLPLNGYALVQNFGFEFRIKGQTDGSVLTFVTGRKCVAVGVAVSVLETTRALVCVGRVGGLLHGICV